MYINWAAVEQENVFYSIWNEREKLESLFWCRAIFADFIGRAIVSA